MVQIKRASRRLGFRRGVMVLLAMRSISDGALFLCRSLTASLTLGLLGHSRLPTMRDEVSSDRYTPYPRAT
jgi:hypothetical protein